MLSPQTGDKNTDSKNGRRFSNPSSSNSQPQQNHFFTEPRNFDWDSKTLGQDIRSANQFLLDNNLKEQTHQLMAISTMKALATPLTCWLVIMHGWWLTVEISFLFFPLSVLLTGWSMRFMRNILHDACHRVLFKKSRWEDLFANVTAGFPCFESMKHFRKAHLKHHRKLGSPTLDPDFRAAEPQKGRWKWLLEKMTRWKFVQSFLFGNWSQFSLSEKFYCFMWWFVCLSMISYMHSYLGAAIYVGLWIVAKILVFTPLLSFLVLMDHAGLGGEGIIKRSRTVEQTSLASWFFHPWGDGYHLAHHLFPKVPTYNLKKLHDLLIHWETYNASQITNSYFFGPQGVINLWKNRLD